MKRFLLVCGAMVVAAGCGSGHTKAATAPTTPPPTTRLMPVSPGGPPGPVVTVPTENGSPIDDAFDAGSQIVITPTQFEPQILVANIKSPITWTNLTTVTQTLTFIDSGMKPEIIPPGRKWSYTAPNGVNLHYRDPMLGLQGTVDFNPSP